MPNNYEVSITLSALDNASESLRQTRGELDQLLASADAINATGAFAALTGEGAGGLADTSAGIAGTVDAVNALAASDALPALTAALASVHTDAEASAIAAAELPGSLGAAAEQATGLRSDIGAVADALDTITRDVRVIRVRVDVDDPHGVLTSGGGGDLSTTIRANGGTLPGSDPRVHAPGGGR